MSKSRAFTLIEVLVALVIFSILAVIVSQSLRAALETKARFTNEDPIFHQLQLALIVMERDISQSLGRKIRNSLDQTEAGFYYSQREKRMSFTRTGIIPLNAQEREISLARVGYQLQGNTLYRLTWPYLDRRNDKPNRQVLLSDVQGMTVKLIGPSLGSYDIWPPTARWEDVLPLAVEMTLATRAGEVRRIFYTGVRNYETL